jgi:long-subunit fatty acid transport protein
MIFVPTTYGLSARSIALGNAVTAVGDDYSAAFFNPGALGRLATSQVDLNYLYAAPRFTGGRKGGDDVSFTTANKLTLIGFTMNLSNLFKKKHGLGLGFDIAIDDNLKSFLEFQDVRDERGTFARYGLSSVTMATGLGVQLIKQLYVGVGGFILVHGETKLVAKTDMAGNTREQQISMHAEPAFGLTAGIFAPVHPMVTLGASYRMKAVANFDPINAETEALVSDSKLTTLNLALAFKDTYVPQQATLGVAVRPIPELLLSVEGSWINWADFEHEVARGDSTRKGAEFETRDLFVPRLGIEWTAIDHLFVRFGYTYENTPFARPGTSGVVILDNAKHVGSLGLAYDITQIRALAHPVTIGAAYFHHYLVPRTVTSSDGVEYESRGNLNGVIGTLTLRF